MSAYGTTPGTPAAEHDTTPGTPAVEHGGRGHDLPRWAQVGATVAAILTALGAILVAWQGQKTVDFNSQTALRQSEDTQLSTAITALGSSDTSERIAGLLLLARNTSSRFELLAQTHEPPTNAYDDYTTTLQILSGYLNNHSRTFITAANAGNATAVFGRGYGLPPPSSVPLDLTYAANQITYLLSNKMERMVRAGKDGQPAIDLSDDELIGQPWNGIDFGWISAFMPGIDLRGADLSFSKWRQSSDLSYSYLQCANLAGADLRGANLTYADLRGANVNGADFRGAHIHGAEVTQLYGKAKWPRWRHHVTTLPVSDWNQSACLQNRKLWDKPSTGKGIGH